MLHSVPALPPAAWLLLAAAALAFGGCPEGKKGSAPLEDLAPGPDDGGRGAELVVPPDAEDEVDTGPVVPSCLCGDGVCAGANGGCEEFWEDGPGGRRTCAVDCAPCGNGTCDPGEGVTGPHPCFADCCGACGDGICKGGECGEDPLSCALDCAGGACGDAVCDMGENPIDCPFDCGKYACGNGTCEPGESPYICPVDCLEGCGNCVCDPTESYVSCPADCGYCGDGYCFGQKCPLLGVEDGVTCPFDCCVPQCGGKECGDDGCGYSCGACPTDDACRSACHAGYCGPATTVETRCDGLDEDCDGQTDEDLAWTDPETGAPLLKGDACDVAMCAGAVLLCTADHHGLACSVDVAGELCDGQDNDCDGQTDAGDGADLLAGDPRPCEQTLGVCAGATKPVQLCVAGTWIPCGAEVYAAASAAWEQDVEASCDGLDNDCDGEVDEDFELTLLDGRLVAGVGAACGVGLCAGGETTCGADGTSLGCPTEAFASAEACNGKDDDCDGLTDEGCGAQPGEPCTDDEACEGGWCVEAAAGYFCTPACAGGGCPDGTDCLVVQHDGELVSMCVPRFPNLCRPCTSASDCVTSLGTTGDACVDLGAAGAFCGGGCAGGLACPAGFSCQDVTTVAGYPSRQCVPESTSGECVCTAKYVAEAAETSCSVTSEHGTCWGTRLCAADGLTACDAATAEVETCNGADDDCDGETDEGFLLGGVYLTDQHCGACHHDCEVEAEAWPNALGGGCQAGTDGLPGCAPICAPGFVDLNHLADAGDGCECQVVDVIDLVDPEGLDVNCDGLDGVDADGDGVASEQSGGTDCRDDLWAVHPGAEEVCGDGVDDDCDGTADDGC